MTERERLTAELTRLGRRHGWNVTPIRLGYYKLRFDRSDGTVQVRIGPTGRIADVVAEIHGVRRQLSLPARPQLENMLMAPPVPPADTDPLERAVGDVMAALAPHLPVEGQR